MARWSGWKKIEEQISRAFYDYGKSVDSRILLLCYTVAYVHFQIMFRTSNIMFVLVYSEFRCVILSCHEQDRAARSQSHRCFLA